MTNSIHIGRSYNLLDKFDSFGRSSSQLGPDLEEAIELSQTVSVSNAEIVWDPIRLSLLKTTSALVEYLGLFQLPGNKYDGQDFFISPNFLNEDSEKERVNQLSNQFDFQFNLHSKYIVLELRRQDLVKSHEVFKHAGKATFNREKHLTRKWQFDSVKLRPGKKISYKEDFDTELEWFRAQKYIDTFYKYGTHFISNIVYGERILQFFEIKASSFERIDNLYNDINHGLPISGVQASIFNVFLSEEHCVNISKISSLSKDKELDKMLENGFLQGTGSNSANLLLASSWNKETIESQLGLLTKSIETQVILRSMGRFLGYFRAMNYDRILKGALAQRWGRKVSIPIRRLRNVDRNLQSINKFPRAELKINDSAYYFGDSAEANSIEEHSYKTNQYLFRLFSIHAKTGGFQLAGHSLSSQFIEGASNTANSEYISVNENQFSEPNIICGKMYGSIYLTNAESKEENLVYDGLRFAERMNARSGLKEIYIVGDILERKAFLTHSVLAFYSISSAKAAAVVTSGIKDQLDLTRIKSFLDWLSGFYVMSDKKDKHVFDLCKYWGNSEFYKRIGQEEIENKELKEKIDQFITKTNYLDRHDVTMYNFRSLEYDLQSDHSLNDLARQLDFQESSIVQDYQNVLNSLIDLESINLEKKSLEAKNIEIAFCELLSNFKVQLQKCDIDELVENVLYYLSKTTDQIELFTPHKNLIRSRFEERKIAVVREFNSLTNFILGEFSLYKEIAYELKLKKSGEDYEKLLEYLAKINWNKGSTNDKYALLFAAVREVLVGETKLIDYNELRVDQILSMFKELSTARSQMHFSLRVLLDMKLNLYYSANAGYSKVNKGSNLLKVNLQLARLQYHRNIVQQIRSNIHKNELQNIAKMEQMMI